MIHRLCCSWGFDDIMTLIVKSSLSLLLLLLLLCRCDGFSLLFIQNHHRCSPSPSSLFVTQKMKILVSQQQQQLQSHYRFVTHKTFERSSLTTLAASQRSRASKSTLLLQAASGDDDGFDPEQLDTSLSTIGPSSMPASSSSSSTTISSINEEVNDVVKYNSNADTSEPSSLFSSNIMSISDSYDGGNIECVHVQEGIWNKIQDSDNNDHIWERIIDVQLQINPDIYTELEQTNHFQYFSFRSVYQPSSLVVSATQPSDDCQQKTVVNYRIINAGHASYSNAFYNYTVFSSHTLNSNPYNEKDGWKRQLSTTYDGNELTWTYEFNNDNNNNIVYFCYFPPYSYERHLHLIEKCASASSSSLVYSIGKSIQGRDIDCIQIGTGSTICWIIHRQHPGETMAEYYAEGILCRLLQMNIDNDDDIINDSSSIEEKEFIHQLLFNYTFYIIPNMNPDGSILGHLRTNAIGANLNREWCSTPINSQNNNINNAVTTETIIDYYNAPTIERSPEVYGVLNHIDITGCDIFLDIHGDEMIPYNFGAQPASPIYYNNDDNTNVPNKYRTLHNDFMNLYVNANTDMQTKYGYGVMSRPSTIYNTACKQIATRYKCLSITLEMPFKDCLSNSNPILGWNPLRSKQLGASVLEPIHYMHPYLR